MIILIMIVFALATFATWAFVKHTSTRIVLGSVLMVLLALSVVGLTLNFSNHFGMKKVSTTTESKVYSASSASPAGMLITQRLGTKADNYVLVYSKTADAKKPTTFGVPDKKHISTAVNERTTYRLTDKTTATAKTVTTRWEWKNDFYRIMFGVGGQGGEIAKRVKTVYVPKTTWVVLTAEQAKQMQASQAAAQSNPTVAAAQQAQMKTAVEAKVAAYMQANPQASQSQIQAATKTATAEVAAQAIKQSLAQ